MNLVGKCQQRLPLPLLLVLPHFTQPDKLTGNPGICSAATVFYFPTSEKQQREERSMLHVSFGPETPPFSEAFS